MTCSISAEKSSSNWLDRLRSTKGFPTSGDLTLDHFLTNPTAEQPPDSPKPDVSTSNSNINSSNSVETSAQIEGERDWFGVMNHVLSDLFVMGGGPTTSISASKSARKQTNPKFFPLPPPPEDDNKAVAVAVASSFNSDHNSNINDDCGGDDDDVEEDDKYRDDRCRTGDEELRGYSRSEVTVIDTSYEVWKFDKLVFRRKNDWKVRDKKGRPWLSSSAIRKRKKSSGGEMEPENDGGAKKRKAKVFSSHAGSSIVVTNGRNCASQFDDNPQQEKTEGVSKEGADDLISQVPKHRLNGSSEVSEKLLRKKDVWKVRDKKDKPWLAVAKKKKKGIGALRSENDHHGIASGAKTKTKVFNSHVGSSTVFSDGRSSASPFDDARNENERMEDVSREVADELISQIPKHRFHGSRSPRMSKKGSSSSVVLTKALSNGKKSGENVPRDQLKDRQWQQNV